MRKQFAILLILSLALHAAALWAFSSSRPPVRLRMGGPAVTVSFTESAAAPAVASAPPQSVEIPAPEISREPAAHAAGEAQATVPLDQPIHDAGKPITQIHPIAKPIIVPSRPPVEKVISKPVEKPLEKTPETPVAPKPPETKATPITPVTPDKSASKPVENPAEREPSKAMERPRVDAGKPKANESPAAPASGKVEASTGNKAAPRPTEVYPPSSASVDPLKRTGPSAAAGSSGAAGSQGAKLASGNKIPPYPRLARERGYQGTTLLELRISTAGKVIGVKVVRSSGYAILDSAAAKDALNWTFSPAKRDGKAVEDKVMQPVVFEIQE